MRLVSVEIHGYKRFADPTKVNLDAKVIAVVGPNEAGKTSLIEAMRHLEHNDPFPSEDLTRRAAIPGDQVIVRALYRLEEGDLHVIRHLHGAPTGHVWYALNKAANGQRTVSLEPRLRRNTASRRGAVPLVERLLRSPWLAQHIVADSQNDAGESAEPGPLAPESIELLLRALESDARKLPPDAVTKLGALVERLEALEGGPQYAAKAIAQLRKVYEHEAGPHPHEEALELLDRRRPEMMPFDEAARDLRYEYDLDTQADNPPKALASLAGVAALDLIELRDVIRSGETGTAAQLLEDANERLRSEYASWTQSGVRPRFDREGQLVHVHVSNAGGGYMKLNERSAGLRAYVALVATTTTTKRMVKPVFIIDEPEMHLHYDAQADLVKVFTQQDAVGQVIYSTHSAGCLPEDLGAAVRIVAPVDGTNHSMVRNKFWAKAPGFSPLLLGMGAATLAFFPLREAVVSEGPTELVVLGTLLREAIGRDDLGFQVVPGAANARPAHIAGLDLQAPRMAWLVDGDAGGRALAKKIVKQGVPGERVVALGGRPDSGLVLEDLIDPDRYVAAINEELGRRGNEERITAKDLGSSNRPRQVAAWCAAKGVESPDKVAVAYHVVGDGPGQDVCDRQRIGLLRTLHQDLLKAIAEAG